MFLRYRFSIVALWTIAATLLLTRNAMAYVGPGAGMEFIGYAMSLAAMIGIAFFSIIMWPFYAFMRWIRGPKVPVKTEQPTNTTPTTPVADPAPPPPTATDPVNAK